jgi:hypothetical protein
MPSKTIAYLDAATAHLGAKSDKFLALLNRTWLESPNKWEQLKPEDLDQMFNYWIDNGKLPASAL